MSIICSLLAACLLIQFIHWRFIFRRAVDDIQPLSREGKGSPLLCVVICFHNKWEEAPEVLHCLEQQTYRNFELVLVNDGPVELNQKLVQNCIREKDYIHYIEYSKTAPGKKGALATGIKSASSDWIVLTDIDCQPGSAWLETLSKHIPSYPAILLGYSPYKARPGFLNFVVRHETLLTAFQYLGWARTGHPYMGVGRNMACHKKIYQEVTFDSHSHIPMGDDDLFVNEAAYHYPVDICNDHQSFVVSEPVMTWIDWYRQKARHKSAGKYYSFSSKFRLVGFLLALILEKILLIALIFVRFDLFLIFMVFKMVVTMRPLQKLYRKFDAVTNFWKMWIYEWFHVLYLILVIPFIFFITKRRWD